jgi:metal-responsive CopG/Arc/MetJ family transcriptional regulator
MRYNSNHRKKGEGIMPKFQISVPVKTAERLAELVKEMGYPRSQVVTLAIDDYVEKKKKGESSGNK